MPLAANVLLIIIYHNLFSIYNRVNNFWQKIAPLTLNLDQISWNFHHKLKDNRLYGDLIFYIKSAMAADDVIKKSKVSFFTFLEKATCVCLKTRPRAFFRKYLFLCQIAPY